LKVDADTALRRLLSLTEELTADKPLEDFLAHMTQAAIELLPADHASVRLLDGAREQLLAGARAGIGATEPPAEFRRGEGVLGWVVEHGAPARIDDVEHDSRYVSFTMSHFNVRALLAEPLWASGEVIGVFSVSSPTIRAFDASDQLFLRLLANCSAPPIERARLRRLAMFDDITMAFNHRYLMPRLGEEIERASRASGEVSVLLMDLDHFKEVNDSYGHKAGDVALRLFSDRVRASVRRVDVLVRRGGEEFVLIMPNTGPVQAFSTATRIREAVAKDLFDVGLGVRFGKTVSIGVATWDGRESPEQLEARADNAMYEAKRLGRNRVVVAR
jgi:two-component system cell cycle response regulator